MFLPILAVLIPIAIYCWVLAAINRRERPTLVSGVWDCIGMLLAVSGILLVVGPVLLSHTFNALLAAIPPDQEFEPQAKRWLPIWWLAWGVYFAVLILGVYFMLWSRKVRTVIYNVDVRVFGQVLGEVLSQAGITSTRTGNRLLLKGPPADGEPVGELIVEVFSSMSNIAIRWRHVPTFVRSAIERGLAQALDEETRALDNPATNWLLALTGVLIGMVFLTGMVWVLLTYFPRR